MKADGMLETGGKSGPVGTAARVWAVLPGLKTVVDGGWGTLRYDVVAAITLAAYVLPAAIGDASLAGLPPESGLYACLFSGLVFWIFCSARHTAVTVTSAISLLMGATLGGLAGGDTSKFAAMAAATALLVSVMALVAWLVKAGALVNFISESVMVGFKAGVALHLASSQLPKLFGVSGGHGDFFERMYVFFEHVGETNLLALGLGAAALGMLGLGKVFLKNKPVALFVMAGGIAVAGLMHVESRGVRLLGTVPQGLPSLGLPGLGWSDANDLIPLAMACFLLAAVETAAIGRTFSLKHGYRLDSNQDFLALAAANVAAGLGKGYPVSGGMSQSLVNESAGARTSLAGFLSALLIGVVAVFFSGVLRNLPQPVLAAIVLIAVIGLFNVKALKRLWRFGHGEFGVAMAALVGVLAMGLLRGVLIGAVISLWMVLRRGSRLHTAELGRVPGSDFYADCVRHPENERVSGVFVFRAEGALLYFNVDHVRDRFYEMLEKRSEPISLVIFYLGAVPMVDMAGAELLAELLRDLKERGIALQIAEARGGVREALRQTEFGDCFGEIRANRTIAEVLASAGMGGVKTAGPGA